MVVLVFVFVFVLALALALCVLYTQLTLPESMFLCVTTTSGYITMPKPLQQALYTSFKNQSHECRPLSKRQRKSKAPTVMQRWMLMAITQLDPQDKIASLICQQRWQPALEVAVQFQLSPDDIYK